MVFVTITFKRRAYLAPALRKVAAGAPVLCKEACFITINMAELSLHDIVLIIQTSKLFCMQHAYFNQAKRQKLAKML